MLFQSTAGQHSLTTQQATWAEQARQPGHSSRYSLNPDADAVFCASDTLSHVGVVQSQQQCNNPWAGKELYTPYLPIQHERPEASFAIKAYSPVQGPPDHSTNEVRGSANGAVVVNGVALSQKQDNARLPH